MFVLRSRVRAGSIFLPSTSALRAFASPKETRIGHWAGAQAEPLPAPTFAAAPHPRPRGVRVREEAGDRPRGGGATRAPARADLRGVFRAGAGGAGGVGIHV